ncbi:hypothetical protein TWF694_008669 [Orbilia ellipsospora]|uniref:ABC1 atypical kinase-like domain-containing protein n=1 Tax=Orbilia ellipsospora TaxID=2528407 RepID=A0AAV9XCZ7_9PEZI
MIVTKRYRIGLRCLECNIRSAKNPTPTPRRIATPRWALRPLNHLPLSIGSATLKTLRNLKLQRTPQTQVTKSSYPSIISAIGLTSLSVFFLSTLNETEDENREAQTEELRILAESEREYNQTTYGASISLRKNPLAFVYANYYIQAYIIEPTATGLRFLHLALIFLPVILTMPMVWLGPRLSSHDSERSGTIWWYTFLVHSMERAGPTFIKLGQWAASRTDIFPVQMCSIMSTLHSNVAAHPFSQTKKTIEDAFNGRALSSIFLEFEEKPLGVGAIAQVYRAKLSHDLLPSQLALGSPNLISLKESAHEFLSKVDVFVKATPRQIPSGWVAIKVLHPRVERLVHRDLRIMKIFANIINIIPTLEWLSLPDEVDKFGEMMRLQLDLRIEANNLTRFRDNFKSRTSVTFPAPYTDYSTRQILVEEFAHGIPLETILELGGGAYQKQIADTGLDAFLHMLLIDNFAHADLHPGNILVRFYKPISTSIWPWQRMPSTAHSTCEDVPDQESDAFQATKEAVSRLLPLKARPIEWGEELTKLNSEGFKPQLIFIDTGLVTELSPVNRKNFLDLFTAVAEFDGYKAGELMVNRCRQPSAVIDKDIFCLRMQHLVLEVKGKTFTLGKIKIADVLSEVMSMIRSHHVRLEGDFINVVVSILLLEGIGRRLDPGIDIFKSSLPILRQLGAQKGHDMLKKDVSILKIWIGLELRTILSSSLENVDYSFLTKHLWTE